MLKLLYYLTILIVIFFPKINVISVSGSATGVRIEDFLILLIFIIWIFNILKNKKITFESKKFKKVVILYLVYIFVCIISCVFGIFKNNISLILSLLYFIRKIEYFSFIIIGFDFIKSEKDYRKAIKMFDASILIHFIIIILQSFGIVGSFTRGNLIEDISGARLCSTFNGAYEFSAYLLLLLPIYLYGLINEKNNKLKNVIYILLIITEIMLSQSRSSIIIIALEVLAMLFLYNKSVFKRTLFSFIALSGLIILLSFSNLDFSFLPRFDTLNMSDMLKTTQLAWENRDFEMYRNNTSSKAAMNTAIIYGNADLSFCIRISRWMHLLDGFLHNFLIGMGLSVVQVADGNYIRLLVETGLIGFTLWMYLMYKIINVMDNSKKGIIMKVSTISILLGAIFIDVFDSSKIISIYWFILGIILKSFMLEENSNGKEN